MRRFQLERDTDVSGISGTGTVADGVEFPDGTVVIRWRGERQSTVVWPGIEDVEAIHGHGGATRIVWVDLDGPCEECGFTPPTHAHAAGCSHAPAPKTGVCRHCGLRIGLGVCPSGWGVHLEGSHKGLQRCGKESGQPYGLNAHTADTPCSQGPCSGANRL